MQKTNLVFRVLGLFLGLLLLVTLLPGTLLAQGKNERAVRAIIADFIRAHNSVDPAVVKGALRHLSPGVAALYSPFGKMSVAQLPGEIDKQLANLSSHKFTAKPYTVYMDGKIAWTTFDWTAESTALDGSRQTLAGRATFTFAKEGKAWRIKHLHNSLPAARPASKAANEADAQTILDIEYASWSAYRDKQVDALAGSITDGFSALLPGSAYRIQGKNAYLRNAENWMSQNEMQTFQILDPKVEISGDTALLTYYFSYTATEGGHRISTAGKATTIYKKDRGRWLAWHHHSSVNQAPPQRDTHRDRDR